ncbi:MAG TPA: MFS transporter [Microbacteriaceae bacterium]|nr:MFS transporter [Microbacteriaceae bacterium]
MLRRFGVMIYGPTTVFALGEGAVLPLIPIFAAERGADPGLAAFIAGLLVIGQLCGNIPAGALVPKVGERFTMVFAGGVVLVGAIGMALLPGLVELGASAFLIGVGAAGFGVARHAFMTTRVPISFRARALALLGGSFRLGIFVGPFVAAGLLFLVHDQHAAVWFLAVCVVGATLMVLIGPDPERAVPVAHGAAMVEDTGEAVTGSIPRVERIGVFRTMWRHRSVLARLGASAACLASVRAARQIILPLFGVMIGLDAATIALIIGISGAVDFALFYASGQVMDRFGRLWAVLPALILMGVGYVALALTVPLPQDEMWYAMFAIVIAVGNGISSGILLTLGADTAPPGDPGPYLGSWRTLTDAGGAATTLLVSAITALVSLPAASLAMGVIALAGCAGFIRWIPRFVPRGPAS